MIILKGRWVWLREIKKEDIPVLCAWRNDARFMSYCSTRRNNVSLREFEKEIEFDFGRDRHLQCMIFQRERPVGTVYSYNLNHTDGYIFVTLYIVDDCVKRGYGVEAFALFLHHLFQTIKLYKVYAEVYAYNQHSLDCLKKAGFIEEGRFRGHRFYQNQRHDLIRLSFFERDLLKLERFISDLTKRSLANSIHERGW